jgi:hypothetical protein
MESAPTAAAKVPQTRTPASMIIFLLLVFPPAAWFLIWIDKTYHHWFGKILIFSGIFAIIITLSSFATIGTQTDQLYASLGVKNSNAALITLTNYLGVVFALLQIFFGIYIQRIMRHKNSLSRTELCITVLLLATSLYVALIPSLLVFQDIYPALYNLYQGPSY